MMADGKGARPGKQDKQHLTYAEAGVDIDAGAEVVERIRSAVASTTGSLKLIGGLGGFAGMLELPAMKQPVLVSATDGVGTKVLIAEALGRYNTVGIDLVAMSVNDLITVGARPLFFLDYLAVGRLEPQKAASLVEGVAEGCRQAGCALLGGETAEMPDLYQGGHFDLAGFAVGAVEKEAIIDGSRVQAGDALIGLPSTGLHSNGFSLVRKILEVNNIGYQAPVDELFAGKQKAPGLEIRQLVESVESEWRELMRDLMGASPPESPGLPQGKPSAGDILLTPTKIYAREVAALMTACDVRAIAHITGGGLPENLPRVIPAGLGARLDTSSWTAPPIFTALQKLGNVETAEMMRTFNMGIGLVACVPAGDAQIALETVAGSVKIGEVVKGAGFELTERQ